MRRVTGQFAQQLPPTGTPLAKNGYSTLKGDEGTKGGHAVNATIVVCDRVNLHIPLHFEPVSEPAITCLLT